MRVALNMLFLAPGLAGTRIYSEGLLRGLAAVAPSGTTFTCVVRGDCPLPKLPADRFEVFRAPVSGSGQLLRTAWEYTRLPGLLPRRGVDLLHGAGNVSPRVPNRPFVLTLHDINYHHAPESYSLGYRAFMRVMCPRMARRADRVIVPSGSAGEDAVAVLGVDPARVRTVAYGPGHGFHPADPEQAVAVAGRYGLRPPYVISVARGYRHKNLAGLIRAFACLPAGVRAATQLALVGDRNRLGPELETLAGEVGIHERIVFTGFLPQGDLNAVYSAAAVFAFPSLAEGFGLPVLEAMACGVPVVASDASAVPEAVGDAGLIADARNPAAFGAAIETVLGDAALRSELARRGLVRVAEFTWEKCAAQTLSVYRELA